MSKPSGHPKESNDLKFKFMFLDKNGVVYLRTVTGRSIHKYIEQRKKRYQ